MVIEEFSSLSEKCGQTPSEKEILHGVPEQHSNKTLSTILH